MRYFSGFCLEGEAEIFENYLINNDFCVAGFSYGATQAFEFALTCKERIDTLQLFSPAFFQDKDAKFKKLQTLFFAKNKESYCQTFLENIAAPSSFSMQPYFKMGESKALETLLYYEWDIQKLQLLKAKNISIEVYLGEKDSIINASTCKDFFMPFASVYFFKNLGHILH